MGSTVKRGSMRAGVGCLAILWLSAAFVPPARGNDSTSVHEPFDRILRRYVDASGRVAYRSLEREARDGLRGYLASLAELDPESLDRPGRIAFWINAYNAHVINGVLSGYNAEGLIARKRFFSWYSFRLAGAERTLSEIEHQVLRTRFDEPRIHFALVCASTSCPVLRAEAYRGATLDAQLDDQARRFIGDPERNRIGADEVRLSRIFEWFADDFEKSAGSVEAYVRRYTPLPEGVAVSYLEYDWTMNAQAGQRPG